MPKLRDFSRMTDKQMLEHYAELMRTMKERTIIRSNNNPVSDYAEKLASDKLGLQLCSKSTKGYDAIKNGQRFQIKSRRITANNKSRQLGVIRNLEDKLFDYLIIIIFDEAFTVKNAYRAQYSEVWNLARTVRKNKHQGGYTLHANSELISHSKDITSRFR